MPVPAERLRTTRPKALNAEGSFVLYWMTAQRRCRSNYALDHAIDQAQELGCGLVVLEALRLDYPWASARFHDFVMRGMADNARACSAAGLRYLPFVETTKGAGRGLLATLAAAAKMVVADDFPSFFLPAMYEAAAKQTQCRIDWVDSFGLLPMRASERWFPTAYAFRRYYQKELRAHFALSPQPEPLKNLELASVDLDLDQILADWPMVELECLAEPAEFIKGLDLDHQVAATPVRGGAEAAAELLERFLTEVLPRYCEARNHPDERATSEFSPYLHFGHLSPHEIFARLHDDDGFDLGNLPAQSRGKREGFWGLDANREAFLDQLITWRELGYHNAVVKPESETFDSLPDWALATMLEHESDPREPCYNLHELETSATYDELWNAAQRELRTTGRMHNYLRMLWGKKILEWAKTPREALRIMLHLNNKYALDGRNPNSTSGIFWVLGRYDRAWGPERPIFGKIRYMASANTRRKLRLKDYLMRFAAEDQPELF